MNVTKDVGWLDSPSVLDSCIERLKAVKAVGLETALDFHGRLHRPMAKQLVKALEPHRPLFIEEPVLSKHPEALKQLAGMTSVPIALGERLYNRWDIKPFLKVVDVLQPDVGGCTCPIIEKTRLTIDTILQVAHAGGISELKRIASMCEAYDAAIAPHCPIGPIAFAACLHIDLSTPNFAIQEMPLGIHYNIGGTDLATYLKDQSVFEIKNGYIEVLNGPGLGIDIDEELVRRVAKATEPWQPVEFYGPDGGLREWRCSRTLTGIVYR